MNNKELEIIETIFAAFLMKIRKKTEIKFQYYSLRTDRGQHDCAFTGYYTNEGIHGLHFNRTLVRYYFGERNAKFSSTLVNLHEGLIMKIPPTFKNAFLDVANNKKNLIIRNNKMPINRI